MPYKEQDERSDSSIGMRLKTKQRLERALYNRRLLTDDFTWDWFLKQVAIKLEKGKI